MRLRSDAKQVRRKGTSFVAADGITFPILAALSNFVKSTKEGKWRLVVPAVFKDERLIEAARRQLRQQLGKPMLMGRSGAAYEGLMMLTEMANDYSGAK